MFAAGLVVARLFFLQIVSGDYYQVLAARQHNYSTELAPRRGSIYIQNKEGERMAVAGIKEGYDIFVNPKMLNDKKTDPDVLYGRIAEIVEVDRDYFMGRLVKKNDPYEIIVSHVDRESAERIKNLNIEGVGIVPAEWRYYPAGRAASQVVGFVGYNGDKLEGRYGIERYFDNQLSGKGGYTQGARSAQGFLIDLGKRIFEAPEEGNDIVLTLNIDAQLFLEKALSDAKEKWRAESAGGLVMDPVTGKILAMAALPDFDPNNYQDTKNINAFMNSLTEKVYEIGSVFKPLTLAAAIDRGAITPETKYHDDGFLVLNGRRIANYDGKGRGDVDMQKVLDESLNTGAVFAMQQLGKKNFYDYMVNYGIDEKTGIELPDEVVGNMSNLDTERDIEYATAAYGQGISVTALGAARAFSALANGGVIMKPYIVDRIIKSGESDDITKPEEVRRVLKPETSEVISRMLVRVVDEALAGGTARDAHYTMAAKTGTAFIPKSGGGGYSDEMVHTFFGYAPGFDPKFLIFLYLEKPQGVRYASQSLTATFMDTIHFLLNYYQVPPDR
ncbi:MAG: penicillin-binding protein 2 [Patescibacteria group bacterium]